MKYIIPIAAPEAMFPRDEFHFPKPQVEIDGQPMIARVIENLRRADRDAKFIFITRAEDCATFSLEQTLRLSAGDDCTVIQLDRPTQGAVCSILMAIDHIDDDPIVIANGDQLFDNDLSAAFADFRSRDLDVGVVTFESVHPRWSYVRQGDDGSVVEAAEKQVISRNAIAGIYYFHRGTDFLICAEAMIENGRSVGGKYFIAPTINEAVLKGLKAGYHRIAPETYHSLYSPKRVEDYEHLLRSRKTSTALSVQVVIPMAGLGSRFAEAGYEKPKPFIDVLGRPMIAHVMDNVYLRGARYILPARVEHLAQESNTVQRLLGSHNAVFIPVDKVTEGAACTVLLARGALDRGAPLLIANSDQFVDFDCTVYIEDCIRRNLDGSILCFRAADRDPKWSFAKVDGQGLVTEVQEKQPISDLATVGLYFFRRAGDFFDFALDMIARNDRTKGEFYVCPVYNYAIASGSRIGVYEVPADAMHGLGTPADLDAYVAHVKST
jgi:dTDP-glucose pyrophosphorylase